MEENTYKKRFKTGDKVLLIITILIFFFLFYITLDANKYDATVLAIAGEGRVGVNPTSELLDFGDLSPGSSAVRTVSIENSTAIPMYIAALRIGEINGIMSVDKNFFVIPKNTTEEIEFSVYMPASAPIDERLNGKVFLFKIPGPWKS